MPILRGIKELEDIPNVGKSIAKDLRLLNVQKPEDLKGKDAFDLYKRLCNKTGKRQDPCVLDVFISAIRFIDEGIKKPWWHYTKERKAIVNQIKKKNNQKIT